MRVLWILTRQRLADVLRSRSSAGFVLFFPVVLLVVVGFVFMHGHPFEQRYVAVVGQLDPALAIPEEMRLAPARDRPEAIGKLRARMVSAVLERSERGLTLTVGPRDRVLARGIAAELGKQVRIEVLQVPRYGYVHYVFAGLVTFSIVVSGLFATGHTMALYRENRFLKKLATTPLPKITFVAATVGARGMLISLQIALMVAVAAVVFGVEVSAASLFWFTVTALLGLLTFMGVGFVLACVISTDELINDVIGAVNMPLVLLSEIFFPLEALPRPLAVIGGLLPSTEMVRLMRAVLLYGVTDAASLLPGIVLLAGWAVITFAVSLRVFKW